MQRCEYLRKGRCKRFFASFQHQHHTLAYNPLRIDWEGGVSNVKSRLDSVNSSTINVKSSTIDEKSRLDSVKASFFMTYLLHLRLSGCEHLAAAPAGVYFVVIEGYVATLVKE